MNIICTLDSEHYSEPDIKFAADISEARSTAKRDLEDYLGGPVVRDETSSCVGERLYCQGDDEFAVSEIYPLAPTDKYALVQWHGYNGVDFTVQGFEDLSTASSAFCSWNAKIDGDIEYMKENYILFDTGDEWVGIVLMEVPNERV